MYDSALEEVASCAGIGSATKKFLKGALAKRPFSSLERPLREAVRELPASVNEELEHLAIVANLKSTDGEDLVRDWAEAFRILRNGLSHGSRSWDGDYLEPAANLLERIAKAHLLRTVGCSGGAVAKVLGVASPILDTPMTGTGLTDGME